MQPGGVGTGSVVCAVLMLSLSAWPDAQSRATYRVESRSSQSRPVRELFTDDQIALLEKLNRADRSHLDKLPQIAVPDSWDAGELALSPLPGRYSSSDAVSKLLVVHLPGQLFGAYEAGILVRWGPISSGGRDSPTPAGAFTLNWRSAGHSSSVNPNWFMRWYFNFGHREGLAFHEYSLPGLPASHGCIRLLERDARWLFEWGEAWTLDATGTQIVQPGTPVSIIGAYEFGAPPPWRSLTSLERSIDLPEIPSRDAGEARR